MRTLHLIFIFAFLFISCKNESNKQDDDDGNKVAYNVPEVSITSNAKGEGIIRALEEKSGREHRETASVLYSYNNQNYRIERNCGWFEFKQDLSESGSDEVLKIDNMEDIQLINERPRRDLADTTKLCLIKNLKKKLFFLELPFGLNSPTVQKEFLKTQEIKGKSLAELKVELIEDNYDQAYLVESVFWVDEKADEIIYLAVKYGEDRKSVEFLKPINKRMIKGMQFQDYEVYRPRKNKDYALVELAKAFEKDKLKKVKNIEYKNIRVSLRENKCD